MASYPKLVLVTCLVLLVLMEEAKPAVAGRRKRLKMLEQKMKALEECEVCSKVKELNEKLGELQEKMDSKPVYSSCQEIQDNAPGAVSDVYKIRPLPNAEPIEVYCEMAIGGGGFTFLPRSLTRRSDAQQIVDALFKDKKNVLLKLQKKVDRSESYTLIQPHPSFANTDFGVLVNSFTGYTTPQNHFMKDYIFFGIIPSSAAQNNNYQGFKSNGHTIQFRNCDKNPNSLFAFVPNHNLQTPSSYHGSNLVYESSGVAVNWRSKGIPITHPDRMMPNKFFFLTELHFGGCGCYTSSDRWTKYGYHATAIGIH
ncbi:uncharacterized protein LOC144648824 [Oculina patagonica]